MLIALTPAKLRCRAAILTMLFCSGALSDADKVIVLGVPDRAKQHVTLDLPPLKRLEQAFKHLGYRLEFKFYPGKRSLVLSNTGEIDGELLRHDATPSTYGNLIPLASIFRIQPTLYGLKNGEEPSWEKRAIKSVALFRGSHLQLPDLPEALRGGNLIMVNTNMQAVRMVISGRADSLMMSKQMFSSMLNNQQPLSQLVLLTPHLSGVSLYPFLHKKHAALIPKLQEQLRIQKASD